MKKQNFTSQLIIMGILIATEIILTRFLSINTAFLRIGFGFLPVAICAILFGPLWAGVCYAIGDVISITLLTTGTPFPGFTLSAFLTGAVYGIFLHNKEVTFTRVLLASTIIVLFINLGLDSLWLSMLYHKAFMPIMVGRIIKFPLAILIQVTLIPLVYKKIITKITQVHTFATK